LLLAPPERIPSNDCQLKNSPSTAGSVITSALEQDYTFASLAHMTRKKPNAKLPLAILCIFGELEYRAWVVIALRAVFNPVGAAT
jgi:hypothetical protein